MYHRLQATELHTFLILLTGTIGQLLVIGTEESDVCRNEYTHRRENLLFRQPHLGTRSYLDDDRWDDD
jgi:hypothetical protein